MEVQSSLEPSAQSPPQAYIAIQQCEMWKQ